MYVWYQDCVEIFTLFSSLPGLKYVMHYQYFSFSVNSYDVGWIWFFFTYMYRDEILLTIKYWMYRNFWPIYENDRTWPTYANRNIIIPILGSSGPQWGPVKLMCLYVSLSLFISASLSGQPHRFLVIVYQTAQKN